MYKTLAARGSLPETRVGFSPGAFLMRHQSPLGILAGKLLKLGIANNVKVNDPNASSYIYLFKTLRKLVVGLIG